jgi:GLPGLI family protein
MLSKRMKSFLCYSIFLWSILSIPFEGRTQLRFNYQYIPIDSVKLMVTYSLKYFEDSTNTYFTGQEDMHLLLGDKVSLFISGNMYLSDSIDRTITNSEQFQAHLMDRQRPMPRFTYRIYKNFPTGKLTFIDHIPSSSFKFEEELNLFNWQISPDTSVIHGFVVQKAECDFGGRKWIAWFCIDIPVSDGPYKFNGLPGLILKVHDSRNHYVFEFISMSKAPKHMIIDMKQREYLETTKYGFFKAEDAFRDDIISRAKDAGLPSKTQQAVARRMADRNNPIELKRK